MHISVRMTTFSFWIDFRHAHFCMNDYHFFLKGLSSFIFLYEWLPFLFKMIVVMHISVRTTTISFWFDSRHLHLCMNDYHFFLNGLSSFTFLYEWLPFLFDWIVVMHISVWMTTISFWMDSRHLHLCMNEYLFFLIGLSSFTFLYEWLPFLFDWIVVMHFSVLMTTISFWMDFRHAHFCTNDFHFVLYGFSSCIFCAKTFHILCIWIFVMHFLSNDFPYSIDFSMCAMLFNAWIAQYSIPGSLYTAGLSSLAVNNRTWAFE